MMPLNRLVSRGFLALILLASGGCGRPAVPKNAAEPPPPPAPAGDAGIACTGILHPARSFLLRLKPGETVVRLQAAAGDTVEQGQLLAVLSSPALEEEWAAAQDRMLGWGQEADRLRAALWKKARAEERAGELRKRLEAEEALKARVAGYDPRVQARDLYDALRKAELEGEELELEIAACRQRQPVLDSLIHLQAQRIAQLEAGLSNLTVRAPFPGTVARAGLPPEPGADPVLLDLQDRTAYVARGLLWQNQVAAVEVGGPVAVSPDFRSGAAWTGTVTAVGFAAEGGPAGAFPRFAVTVALPPGPDTPAMREGMTVSMTFIRSFNGYSGAPREKAGD